MFDFPRLATVHALLFCLALFAGTACSTDSPADDGEDPQCAADERFNRISGRCESIGEADASPDAAADAQTEVDAGATDADQPTPDAAPDVSPDAATDASVESDATPAPDAASADVGVDASADVSAPDAGVDSGQPVDDTLNTGDTSGQQAASGEPGAACNRDRDCKDWSGANDQGAICLTDADGFPNGYCTFLGDGSTSLNYGCNGYGGKHVAYSSTWGDGYCYHRCDAPNDCRVGYRCYDGACMPDCEGQTCKYGACDPTHKVCLAD